MPPAEQTIVRAHRVHATDCHSLQVNVHFPSAANQYAAEAGLKTHDLYRLHRKLHRAASLAKHVHLPIEGPRHSGNPTPPPPPPPPPPMDVDEKSLKDVPQQ